MTDRRVLVASALSAVFILLYMQAVVPKSKAVRPAQPMVPRVEQQASSAAREPIPAIDEEEVVIESSELSVWIGAKTGAVRHIALKRHYETGTQEPIQFGKNHPVVSLQVASAPLRDISMQVEGLSATLSASDAEGRRYRIVYTLDEASPFLTIGASPAAESFQDVAPELQMLHTLARTNGAASPEHHVELFAGVGTTSGKVQHRHYTATKLLFFPRRAPENVPRGTQRLTLAEQYFCQSIELGSGDVFSEVLPFQPGGSTQSLLAVRSRVKLSPLQTDQPAYVAKVYFGPRDFFYLKRYGLESALPIGAFGQIGLLLLLSIDWIGKHTNNFGLAIVLFSGLVTLATAPFTIMGMRSMRKLQALQPQMERIRAQHGNDQKKVMEATMALYRQHRVSPFGGCLPMLVPMPIFIALYQGLRHFIALRGQGFLWINDLTQPDRAARVFGIDINALPIVLAGLMVVQSKLSRGGMPKPEGNSVAAAMSGPMMPILFGFMFYSVPSGLVLYWLTNSLFSLFWYRLAK